MSEEVLTVDEVAERLRVTPQTVRKLIKQGKLKAFTVGTQIRVTKEDLDGYINQSRL